jgi:hypothetical protein
MYTHKGPEASAKFYFMGDIWQLGEKYLQNLKLKKKKILMSFSVTRFQKKEKSTKFLCHISTDSQQCYHMVHL